MGLLDPKVLRHCSIEALDELATALQARMVIHGIRYLDREHEADPAFVDGVRADAAALAHELRRRREAAA